MTSPVSTNQARDYLDRVRSLLSDLPEDERIELERDLAAHLDELAGDDIEAQLGTPEDFVEEFRATAGLGAQQGSRLVRSIRGWAELIRNDPALGRLARRWPDVRPVWVGVRGWLLVSLLAVAYSSSAAFLLFPIPRVGGSVGGLVAVVAMTAASMAVARRLRQHRRWRVANWGFNLTVTGLLAILALGGDLELHTTRGMNSTAVVADQQVRDAVDQLLPTDLHATTVDGRELDQVRLYDESGRPFDLVWLRWTLALGWPYTDTPGREPASLDAPSSNVYPLDRFTGDQGASHAGGEGLAEERADELGR